MTLHLTQVEEGQELEELVNEVVLVEARVQRPNAVQHLREFGEKF